MTAPIFCDESDGGFGWISPEPAWMGRASHALAADGGVWLVDPVDFAGLDERVRSLGEPRAVLQLLGWHNRDCAVDRGSPGGAVHRRPHGGARLSVRDDPHPGRTGVARDRPLVACAPHVDRQ